MLDWMDAATDAVMGGVVGVMGMVGLAEEPPRQFVLDTMLTGFTEGCEMSPALEVFWWSVVDGQAMALPQGGEGFFSDPQISNRDEFREIRIPVNAIWMGHDVDHVAIYAGNDNGISIIAIRFDAAEAEAELAGTFAPLAERSQTMLDNDPELLAEMITEFVSFGGLSQYYCDYST